MESTTVKHVVLAARPNGTPTLDTFAVREIPKGSPVDGEVMIENLYISLDAGFRNWMDADSGDHILPAMEIDAPVMGLTLGRVVESRHPDFAEGELLMSRLAWEEVSITDATDFLVRVPDEYDCPLSWHLGILGDTGMSAYFGITDLGRPEPGQTVLVSAAGGAVGSVAGQIARLHGARTVGHRRRCRQVPPADRRARLRRRHRPPRRRTSTPSSPGPAPTASTCTSTASAVRCSSRSSTTSPSAPASCLCGSVATYNATEPVPGPSNLFSLVTNQARMEGFMTHLMHDRYPEARRQLLDWVEAGELTNVEHMLHGIENVPVAFCDLFAGRNFGKTVVSLVD